MAVHLTGFYLSAVACRELEEAYKATGKRWDVGNSCVRFRTLDDLPLELIGRSVASMRVAALVDQVTTARSTRSKRSAR